MPRYVSQVNHNGLPFGAVVDIPDAEVENWAGEIEAGFLVPVYEPPEIPQGGVLPDGELVDLGGEEGPELVVALDAEPEPDA